MLLPVKAEQTAPSIGVQNSREENDLCRVSSSTFNELFSLHICKAHFPLYAVSFSYVLFNFLILLELVLAKFILVSGLNVRMPHFIPTLASKREGWPS